MLAHVLLRLFRRKGGREVALIVGHEIVGDVDGQEHAALQDL